MEAKEIFYCNLTLQKGKEIIELKKVVYKKEDGYFKNKRYGVLEPLKVLNVEVIESLGFENNTTDFIEVEKSNEKRNNITGVYE